MVMSRDLYEMTRPTYTQMERDIDGNMIARNRLGGETYEEYLARNGVSNGPSRSNQIISGLVGGYVGYQMAKRLREKSKKERLDEMEQEKQRALRLAAKSRLESDRELIKKRAMEQVRLEQMRNYDYHEMMTHYFLGLDGKDRPFDVDRFGIPYYLDTAELVYRYYTENDLDEIVLSYSDAKRKRLGLESLSKVSFDQWVYGDTINNHPNNIETILADEKQIRTELENYKRLMQVDAELDEIQEQNHQVKQDGYER